jgi:magnesium transporter
MAVIDNAVYVAGHRTADPKSLDETFEVLRDRKGIGVDRLVPAGRG